MELQAAIRGRRSIRKFRTDPVPRAVLEELLETARWAPSWGNTQPWEIHVITGEPLEAFRKANVASMAAAGSPPVTRWPKAASSTASQPVPQPTSSTLLPTAPASVV